MKKLTVKQKKIIEQINLLVNIDINQYIDVNHSKRKFIIFESSSISTLNMLKIEKIGKQYNMFYLTINGFNSSALILNN